MKIRTKLYFLSSILIILIVMIAVIMFYASDQINREIGMGNSTKKMIKNLSDLNLITYEYLTYHEKRMQEQWALQYDSLDKIMKGIEKECIHPKKHHALHESIKDNYNKLGYLFSDLQVIVAKRKRLIEENKPQAKIDNTLAVEDLITGELMMKSRFIISEAFRLSAMIRQTTKHTQQKVYALILFSIIVFVIFASCISLHIIKAITGPINMLVKGTEIIGKGDLGHRFKIKTKDEVGELAAAFNQMAQKRRQAEDIMLKARDELEMRVKGRTAEIAEANEDLKQKMDESKRAKERIDHLNAVLRAIRNINLLMITEKDPDRLIKGVCNNLISTRGYHNAWIALFDESGNFVAAAQGGLDEKFSRLQEVFKRGDLITCSRKAFEQSGVLAILNPSDDCGDCPLSNGYTNREAMTARLEHDDKIYGLVSVSIPKGMATDREEQALFEEIANDIAFSLNVIEVEKKEKQSQEALRESEERYRLVSENAYDAIFIAQDEVVKFPNPKTQEMSGYSAEELARIPFINLVHPEDRDMVLDRYMRWMKGEEPPATYTFRIINKAGKILWVQPNTTAVSWDKRPATLNILRDITSQKELEAQFLQAQKMEAIGTLAGGVAHDFNNLLTTIIANAELSLMGLGMENPVREEIEEIKKAGKSGASLTRQLLAFSRKQVLQPMVLSFNTVTTSVEKMLKRIIGEDVELQILLEPDLGKVKADPGQIEQVIMNLVINARDAMPRGGKLTIETANVDLDENYFRDHGAINPPGPYVMLAVSDTGTGMDKEIQSRIFDPFFTTKERDKGTGLGLSTVYGIIKQSNGYIWVYSEPGEGTTFKIYFPRIRGEAEPVDKQQAPTDRLKGSETVLILEDDDTLRKLAHKILDSQGYTVLEAENGEEALQVSEAHEGPIHLLLTDVVISKISGRETAKRLQPLYPQMKVIYMSGYTDNTIVDDGVLAPELNYLEKPFSPKGLARKVREVLDRGIED